jgi:hypothetical protein
LVNESCNENPIKEGTGKPVTEKAFGSIFTSNYATHPTYIVTDVTVDTFIQALKKQHREAIPAKGENLLFCPSLFNADLCSESDRGLANVVYANGIWLDFDYGHLTHRDLANFFPTVRLVAFNTFSSTKGQPRFRVYIPTSRTLSTEEYRFLTGQIVQVVKDKGYRLPKKDFERPQMKAHGIDLSKLHAASLFYLPCQPKDPKGKIWKDHGGADRHPLDVDDWLENAIPMDVGWDEAQSDHPTSADVSGDQARVDAAMARWHAFGVQPGNGDSELFILSLKLKAANVSDCERKSMLETAARSAHKPTDRLRQVQRLMRSK